MATPCPLVRLSIFLYALFAISLAYTKSFELLRIHDACDSSISPNRFIADNADNLDDGTVSV